MNLKLLSAYLLVASLLGGCAAMEGVLGGGSNAPAPGNLPPRASASDVRGTVQSVDSRRHTVTVSADAGYQSNLRNANRLVLSYDSATIVTYQSRQYSPPDLETGDRIEARIERDGDRLWARSINVIAAGFGAVNPRDYDATVLGVDVRNRTVELTPTGGRTRPVVVEYDSATRVGYQGRAYRPEDLEHGDEVHVTTRALNGHTVADTIAVTRSISGDARSPSARQVRGTVRRIDTATRTIELGGASWAQRFNAAPGGNSIVVGYDAGTVVEYQGRRYGIANLEPGDVVDMDVADRDGPRPIARRIVVGKAS